MRLSIDEIIEATVCEVISNNACGDFLISTDTRTIKGGEIYLPLKGESFDGEKFIENAVNLGAVGYFTTDRTNINASVILKVSDTKLAYLKMAHFLRMKYNSQVVAVTGSSGKTTTKEMIYAVLSEKFKCQKTALNHNNEIGFCQTIFSMENDTEVLILEMGMRGFGEIELLSRYSEPDIAVIANVGTAHIGRLGSRENIAKAKLEITKFLKEKGILIAHDEELIKKTLLWQGENIYYSIKDVEIIEKKVGFSKFNYKGHIYTLNVDGDYNIENALSAIEVGFRLNMIESEIEKGLVAYRPIEKRWEAENIKGYTIINDSYNANPESMKASVETFLDFYKKPVVVLGNMGELGQNEKKYHREVGEFLVKKIENSNCKDAKFLTVGKLSREIAYELRENGIFAENFENTKTVARYILENIEIGTTIFLKASRSEKFEQIIEEIKL